METKPKSCWRLLNKVNTELPHNPAIHVWEYTPKNRKQVFEQMPTQEVQCSTIHNSPEAGAAQVFIDG